MHLLTASPSRRQLMGCAALAAAALLSACASVPKPVGVADTIAATPDLSTLSGLITSAGLRDTLNANGPYTVFAPGNEAFKAVPAKNLQDLAQNPDKLRAVLTYHVVAGKAMAADVKNAKVKSLNGAELELSKAGEFVTVESAAVTKADIAASNGVVHVIDSVLLPPARK